MNKGEHQWIGDNYEKGLVSVVIPTYNRRSLLEEALNSVIKQTYRPIECIVVDDGSNDNTAHFMEKYIKEHFSNDLSIKYFYQHNLGAPAARNDGTKISSGEFIQYLDSDDLLYSCKIQEQVEYLRDKPFCDGVFGDWRTGDNSDNEVVKAYAKADMLEQMLTERCVHTLSFLMRRRAVAKIGPWDCNLKRNQEIDFHLRGLLLDCDFQYYPTDSGLHRKHPGKQITTTTGLREIRVFYQKWEALLKSHNRFTQVLQNKLANLYVWHFLQEKHDGSSSTLILEDAMRLNRSHSIFSSKKLQILIKLIGSRYALHLWVIWFRYKKEKMT